MRINHHALRAIRERSGLTGSELADLAGISQAHYSNIETGERSPSPKVAAALAQALKVPVLAIVADLEAES